MFDIILDWKSSYPNSLKSRLNCQLFIHHDIKMKFVEAVKNKISEANINNIGYAIVPKTRAYDKKYYQGYLLRMQLPVRIHGLNSMKDNFAYLNQVHNLVEIKQDIDGNCFVNDTLVQADSLKNIIRQVVLHDADYAIKFIVNDQVDFSDYFSVISNAKEAVWELRKEYAERVFSEQYDDLYRLAKEEVRYKFPFNFYEISAGAVNDSG